MTKPTRTLIVILFGILLGSPAPIHSMEADGDERAQLVTPRRVAVFGPPDTALLLEANLSQRVDFIVVEREQLADLRNEQALSFDTILPLARSEHLAADAFLGLLPEAAPERWTVVLIEAASGREIGRAVGVPTDRLIAESQQLLTQWTKPQPQTDRAVVVLETRHPESLAVGQMLRRLLHSREIPVLDRTHTWHVLEERLAVQDGFLHSENPLHAFPGANTLLNIETDSENFVIIQVISSEGSVLGALRWSASADDYSKLADFVLPFVLREEETDLIVPYQQRVGLEALLPFYQGVSAFSSGRHLDALVLFQKARELNHRFVAAYEWEERCYESLGLPEFSKALSRWLENGLQGRGVAAGGALDLRQGLTFLGLTGACPEDEQQASRIANAALMHLGGKDLLLPDAMTAWARELDFVAAGQPGDDAARSLAKPSWSAAESWATQFTVRGVIHGDDVKWILADDFSGQTLAETSMPANAETAEIAQTLERLLEHRNEGRKTEAIAEASLPSIQDAEKQLLSNQDQTQKNAALLALLLQQPNHPRVLGYRFVSDSGFQGRLGEFLQYAKRETILRLLPLDDPQRPWIELDLIQLYLPSVAAGRHLSGVNRDGLAELEKFSERNQNHPAGALARFLWLTDMQALMPPAVVAKEAKELVSQLAQFETLHRQSDLKRMAETMNWLARAADGASGLVLDPKQITPEASRMEIQDDGQIRVVRAEAWRVEDFRKLPLTPNEIVTEARAAMILGGRNQRRKSVDPAWMRDLPLNFSLASWVGWIGVYEFGHVDGLPHPHMGDYDQWKEHGREMIRYAVDGLCHWFGRVQTAEQFFVVDAPVHWLVPAMGGFAHHLTDDEFNGFHQRLREASADAAQRLGVPDRTPRPQGMFQLDWRDVTLDEIKAQGADELRGPPNFMRDIPAFDEALRGHAKDAFTGEMPTIREWWTRSNWGLDSSMSNREFATRFIMPFYPELLRTYGDGALSDDERAMLVDTGILLLWGWRYPEAENVFALAANAAPSQTSTPDLFRALKSTALFHLARLQLQARNRPAAIRLLQEVLAESTGLEIRFLLRMHKDFRRELLMAPGQRDNLRSLTVRLLEELRMDPNRVKLPTRTHAIQIPTTQLENADVTIFYRLPPAVGKNSSVLILLPAFNDGGLEMLADSSAWTAFADQYDIVLVVPQFFQNHTIWKVDHPCAPYHFPQLWAGEVLVQALKEIRSQYAIEAGPLHFHGFGAGAQFAARFARWRPELVGSLSLHNGAGFSWKEQEIGLQSTHAYRGLPVLLTVGENEDHGISSAARRDASEVFHTVLIGVGAEVEFHLLDSTFHRPSDRIQELAQTFLLDALNKTNPTTNP